MFATEPQFDANSSSESTQSSELNIQNLVVLNIHLVSIFPPFIYSRSEYY